jgi:hypothetical protein
VAGLLTGRLRSSGAAARAPGCRLGPDDAVALSCGIALASWREN